MQEKPIKWIILEVGTSFRKDGWVKAGNGAAILHSRNWDPWASTKPRGLSFCVCSMAPLLLDLLERWMWSAHLEASCDHGCASVRWALWLLEQEYLHQVPHCPLIKHLIVSSFAGGTPAHAVFNYQKLLLPWWKLKSKKTLQERNSYCSGPSSHTQRPALWLDQHPRLCSRGLQSHVWFGKRLFLNTARAARWSRALYCWPG